MFEIYLFNLIRGNTLLYYQFTGEEYPESEPDYSYDYA